MGMSCFRYVQLSAFQVQFLKTLFGAMDLANQKFGLGLNLTNAAKTTREQDSDKETNLETITTVLKPKTTLPLAIKKEN